MSQGRKEVPCHAVYVQVQLWGTLGILDLS